MWKLSEMSYLKSFYKQRAKCSRRGSRSSRSSRNSDEDDGGHESSASSRQETPTKSRPEVPHPLLDQPSRRPRRLTDDSTSSEGPSVKLGQIVEVMRDSASNLVGRSTLDNQEQERLSFYQWMFESTRKIPTERWRQYQAQAFHLTMSYSKDSAQGNPSTAQASQGSSTSPLPLHPQYQGPPPATHPPPASAGLGRLQPHPTQMVSKLYFVFLSMLLTKLFMFLDN